MEDQQPWINCKECAMLPPEVQQYANRSCVLCGTLHCDECLNEAGYCTSCSEKMSYSKDEAAAV
jgi:hypothetical protein